MSDYNYTRVLLKVSGEALMGNAKFGHDIDAINQICTEIKTIYDSGIQICLVVGGGNICRGSTASESGLERVTADYVGMLATVMNALILQSRFKDIGLDCRVLSAIDMPTICESYNHQKAIRHLKKGKIIIFAAGTGNPYFSTDTAAALRAVEMKCDVMLKATQVDGVYSADPKKDIDAKKFSSISYQDVLNNELAVMDISAVSLAKENKLPIIVFSIHNKGWLEKVLKGQGQFSIIK
jgi:uridylate kinase